MLCSCSVGGASWGKFEGQGHPAGSAVGGEGGRLKGMEDRRSRMRSQDLQRSEGEGSMSCWDFLGMASQKKFGLYSERKREPPHLNQSE